MIATSNMNSMQSVCNVMLVDMASSRSLYILKCQLMHDRAAPGHSLISTSVHLGNGYPLPACAKVVLKDVMGCDLEGMLGRHGGRARRGKPTAVYNIPRQVHTPVQSTVPSIRKSSVQHPLPQLHADVKAETACSARVAT
jgi:hypothetical protein